jgi:hypothetical protein
MKLWLDDIRKPPDETWFWATTANAAIELLNSGAVAVASLDHDLAPLHYTEAFYGEGTGLEVAKHIAAMEEPPSMVIVHSWNSVGAMKMMEELRAAGVNCVRQPAKSFP